MRRYKWIIPCKKGSGRTHEDSQIIAESLSTVLSAMPDGSELCVQGLESCDALETIFTVRRARMDPENTCKNTSIGGDEWEDIPLDDIYRVRAGDGFNCYTREDLENIKLYMDSKDPFTNQTIDVDKILNQNKLRNLLELAEEEAEELSIDTQIIHGMIKVFDGYGANAPQAEDVFLSDVPVQRVNDATGQIEGNIYPYNTVEKMYNLIAQIYDNGGPFAKHRLGELDYSRVIDIGHGRRVYTPVKYTRCGSDLRCLQLQFVKDFDMSTPPVGLTNLDMIAMEFSSSKDAKDFKSTFQGALKQFLENQ